jgi:hypothetical protein
MCDNKVSYYVPKGYDYKEVFVQCGMTDPHGNRAICDTCYGDDHEMERIQQHEDNMDADNAWLNSAGWGEM